MVVEPPATPVTIPVTASTVAIAVLLLLHVPLMSPSLTNAVVEPTHTDEAPLTIPALASGLMVILAEASELPQVPEMV